MRFEWLLFGSLALTLLGGLAFLQRRERSPTGYWIGGWIAAAIGGLVTLLAPGRPLLGLLSFTFGTLFPWFLLAGALVLAERRVPRALFQVALALGVGRAALAGLVGDTPAYLAGLVTDLPALLVAAWYARRVARSPHASLAQRVLPLALLVLGAAGTLQLLWGANHEAIDKVLVLWMLATPPLLGLQLRVGGVGAP